MTLAKVMLQIREGQAESGRPMPELISGADAIQLFLSFVRRQLPVILFIVIFMAAFGGVYIFTARPTYTADAKLMIDTRKVQLFQQQSILGDIPIDTAQVESQVEVIKSENIASAVIKNLHLTEDPEFVSSGGGLLGAVIGFVRSEFVGADSAPPSEFELYRRAMGAFKGRLAVSRVGLTYVIQIEFRSYSPAKASKIANAIADAYIVDQLDAKYKATRRASEWLQDRIKELRDQVSNAEKAVVVFKTTHDIVSTGGVDRPLLNQQQVTELSSQLTIARTQTAEAHARLDRIDSVLKTDSTDMALPDPSLGATVADTLKNEIVTKLRSQYLDLAAREAEWSAKYGANHLAVINLRNQMREIRNSIFQELRRLGETYKSDYLIAQQREETLKQQLAVAVSKSQATDAVSVTLRQLESTAQTYKTIYDNFLQRYMEAVQQQSFPIVESRLISPASRPLGKSSPNATKVFALSIIGGLAIGFGIGILRDFSDRVFRSTEQIESLLHSDCIALVPKAGRQSSKIDPSLNAVDERSAGAGTYVPSGHFASSFVSSVATSVLLPRELDAETRAHPIGLYERGVPLQTAESQEAAKPEKKAITHSDDLVWSVTEAPLSRFSEAIRSIKLAHDLSGSVSAKRVVGLTSSLPNEGKSTISFALAQLMAQVGGKTILVDCDLRNPSISRSLAPRAKVGLIEVIAEKSPLDEVLMCDPATGMHFLPTIVKSRLTNSTEILSSIQMKRLLDKLRERYDYVVVDLPPLAPIVDVRAATHLIDSFVFVIEWGRTKIDVVEHALGHAEGVYDNLLGVVLNKVDMSRVARYSGQRESFYNNKNYARYGYTD